VKADLVLPVLDILPDGSYSSVLASPKIGGKARQQLIEAARAGEDLDQDKAVAVRVIEYEVPDRDGDGRCELIALITAAAGDATLAAGAAVPASSPVFELQVRERRHHRHGLGDRRGVHRPLRNRTVDLLLTIDLQQVPIAARRPPELAY
jgi:hypothetical protein